MLTALGYQPRTYSASFLLIRLIGTMPPTVRYGVDESRRLPLTLHVICLHRTPLTTSMAVSLAWITREGGSCQPTFHQVALAYGPKRPYRDGWIRTSALSHPKRVTYQTSLRPVAMQQALTPTAPK